MEPVGITLISLAVAALGVKIIHISIKSDCMKGSVDIDIDTRKVGGKEKKKKN